MGTFNGKKYNRNQLARVYAHLMTVYPAQSPMWKSVNSEILTQYKESGLIYIKERAHKILEGEICDCEKRAVKEYAPCCSLDCWIIKFESPEPFEVH